MNCSLGASELRDVKTKKPGPLAWAFSFEVAWCGYRVTKTDPVISLRSAGLLKLYTTTL